MEKLAQPSSRQNPFEHDAGALAPLLDWINSRSGPILNLSGIRQSHPEPNWWIYQSELARPIGCHFLKEPLSVSGVSIDGSEALRRNLGEAAERYCAFNALELAETKILPLASSQLSFPLCARDEPCSSHFKQLPLDKDVTHSQVVQLANNQKTWIPAMFVHLSFQPPEGEPVVTAPISTGLAFASRLHDAIWSALCEVAERDAMMICWWHQLCLPHIAIDLDAVPNPLAERLFRLEQAGLVTQLFDISTDFKVPSVFCLMKGNSYPYYTVGAGVSCDAVLACTKAIDEAMAGRHSLIRSARVDSPSRENFEWVKSLEDHCTLYADWPDTPAFDFLTIKNENVIQFSDFAQKDWWPRPNNMIELQELAARLADQGLTVLYSDLTLPEVQSYGSCIKVVVPEMVPMSARHISRWLACRRLIDASNKKETSVFNPYPHPFP